MGEQKTTDIGWRILPVKAEYQIPLPPLSNEEREFAKEIITKFSEYSREHETIEKEEIERAIGEIIEQNCRENQIELGEDQYRDILEACLSHISGFCGLECPISDSDVEEVSVIGLGKPVYIYLRNSGWKRTNLVFSDEELLIEVINKMGREMGRRVTYQKPKLNAILPGGSRIHASIPPLSQGELTIRKFSSSPFAPWELALNGTLTFEALSFLWCAMQFDLRMLVCGNTASGKTTTLNALFSFVPKNERVVAFEDTPEIRVLQPHFVRMIANEELGIGIKEMVWDSLRMRPDRVIVGEVRTREEVSGLVETMLSGQAKGSYATMHAQSSQEAIQRMKNLGVSDMDCRSLDLTICQRRISFYDAKTKRVGEKRRITEIAEVKKEGEIGVKMLFQYDEKKDCLIPQYLNSTTFNRIASFLGISKNEVLSEISRREEFIRKLARRKPTYEESFALIQKFTYGDD
ncbi:MAG: ATPase, T2SS/T4P/T4SS family [Candidatus Anstonellales archaeon]